MGPPLRLKRTDLITRTVPLIRHGLRPCHLPPMGKVRRAPQKASPLVGLRPQARFEANRRKAAALRPR